MAVVDERLERVESNMATCIYAWSSLAITMGLQLILMLTSNLLAGCEVQGVGWFLLSRLSALSFTLDCLIDLSKNNDMDVDVDGHMFRYQRMVLHRLID